MIDWWVAGVGDLWEGTQDLEAAFVGAPPAKDAPLYRALPQS